MTLSTRLCLHTRQSKTSFYSIIYRV